MEPFATIIDLQNRWRPLEDCEQNRASTQLAAASRMIRRLYPTVDDRIESGDLDVESVKDVICAMVARAMTPLDEVDVIADTDTRGPFSKTRKYSRPRGGLYLTDDENGVFEPGGGQDDAFMIDTLPDRPWQHWSHRL